MPLWQRIQLSLDPMACAATGQEAAPAKMERAIRKRPALSTTEIETGPPVAQPRPLDLGRNYRGGVRYRDGATAISSRMVRETGMPAGASVRLTSWCKLS
jgi:hypothetical protein